MFEIVRHIIFRHDYGLGGKLSELGELYLSLTLKSIGLSLIGIFIPIYLWELGYSLTMIAAFFLIIFCFRLYSDMMSAKLTALYGPKHVLTISYLVLIITLGLLVTLDELHWPLPFVAIFYAIYTSTFYVPFFFDLSSVKHKGKEGSELSMIVILHKFASAIGPLLGGIIAWAFGIEATIYLSMIIILIAALPLFATAEIKKETDNVKVSYKNLLKFKGYAVPFFGFGIETNIAFFVWPLFVSLVVFGHDQYSSVGFIVAAGFFLSIVASFFVGKLADNQRGRTVYFWSANLISVINLLRVFVINPIGALFISMVGEPLGSAFTIVFEKGYMTESDGDKQNRLNFITATIMATHIGRIFMWSSIIVMLMFFDDVVALQFSFVIAALGMQLTHFNKFKIYNAPS